MEFVEFTQYMPGSWHRNSAGKSLGERRMSTHLQHARIVVTDFEVARKFWGEQMGFGVRWANKPDGEHVRLIHFKLPHSDEWVEIGNPTRPITGKQLGVVAHMSLEVPDIQVACKQAAERGVAEMKQPLLGADQQWQLNLYDPDGTRIEFMQPKAK
jgi:lactoylglutathione lyase